MNVAADAKIPKKVWEMARLHREPGTHISIAQFTRGIPSQDRARNRDRPATILISRELAPWREVGKLGPACAFRALKSRHALPERYPEPMVEDERIDIT
jgi:hypothetical protein